MAAVCQNSYAEFFIQVAKELYGSEKLVAVVDERKRTGLLYAQRKKEEAEANVRMINDAHTQKLSSPGPPSSQGSPGDTEELLSDAQASLSANQHELSALLKQEAYLKKKTKELEVPSASDVRLPLHRPPRSPLTLPLAQPLSAPVSHFSSSSISAEPAYEP
jgi:hypothetical protein